MHVGPREATGRAVGSVVAAVAAVVMGEAATVEARR